MELVLKAAAGVEALIGEEVLIVPIQEVVSENGLDILAEAGEAGKW